MAEKNSEIDVINHLIEVEKEASVLIDEAGIEAEKRLSEARAKYNAEYKIKYDSVVETLEKDYQKKLEELNENHIKEIEAYKTSLETKNQNSKEFKELLDKLLFAEK